LFFACLKDIGALSVLFPALDSLFSVPQSAKHHPEGDAGVHTLMVVDAAAKLSDSLDVRFAALVHDLGKSLTHPSFWPKHPDHEKAGVPIVEDWGRLFKLPKTTLQLALRATQWHGWIHRGGLAMSLTDMLRVLKGCDAFRQTDRFVQLLTVCEADHQGRTGFENQPYPQKDFWLGALEACHKVDPSVLAADGLTGEKMAQAIEQQRLARLDNFKTQLITMAKSTE
jgi:tRNA nucleotidyltransferase (CCA-adding enzyme)